MERRITIKDIANEANVSVSTVHCALNGKTGVSEKTRAQILEIARAREYKPNSVAASLKRKAVRIALAFPGQTEDNRFYYSHMWAGAHDYIDSVSDFNIDLIDTPYYSEINTQSGELSSLLDRTNVDGLITGYIDSRSKLALQEYAKNGLPVVLVGNDTPDFDRFCCVKPHFNVIGRVLAEFLTRSIPADASVLLCSGDVMVPAHYEIVQGYDAYIKENRISNPVIKVHDVSRKAETFEHILYILRKQKGIAACCCVNARSSVLMGQALTETGLAGKILAVGSDLFEENIRFLKDGVFTSLLNKNPYMQAYLAAKYLVEYLIKDIRPLMNTIYVGNEIVFQSSLPMYGNNSHQWLL